MTSARTFTDKPAVRDKVPLLIGLAGPSGGGKTYSALRLATGMQRISGGDIYVIDTESKRACHYADKFKFRHVEFNAPFGPLDYLAAIDYAHKKGAGVIVVDSMSHEHEGQGGVLEMHQAEVDRMAKGDWQKAERVKMLAWAKPKQERRRLINSLLQIQANFIFCFRAKEKIKIVKGKEPDKLGFMPIAGEEFVFEMTTCGLLLPNAGGVPTWLSEELGERMMIKLPEQFREKLLNYKLPLDEHLGEFMARWAAGDIKGPSVADYEKQFLECKIKSEVQAVKASMKGKKFPWSKEELKFIADLAANREANLPEAIERESGDEPDGNWLRPATASCSARMRTCRPRRGSWNTFDPEKPARLRERRNGRAMVHGLAIPLDSGNEFAGTGRDRFGGC